MILLSSIVLINRLHMLYNSRVFAFPKQIRVTNGPNTGDKQNNNLKEAKVTEKGSLNNLLRWPDWHSWSLGHVLRQVQLKACSWGYQGKKWGFCQHEHMFPKIIMLECRRKHQMASKSLKLILLSYQCATCASMSYVAESKDCIA